MKTPIDWLVDECMFQDTDYFGKEIAWANAAFRNAIRYAYEQGYVDAAINLGETQRSEEHTSELQSH